MITLDVVQGTPEWFAARAGVPSASCFDKVVTSKGERSKQREKYLYQLAAEKVTGIKEESFQSEAMRRGIEMEAEARSFYELNRDVEVSIVGFCYPNEHKMVGCSPDGLVGDGGMVEIKCPASYTHVGYMLDSETLVGEYFQQVQGQLFITGRDWCDLISYYPGLKPVIVRVGRDNKFCLKLADELTALCDDLNKVVEKIK